jgi:hypothetical protein
MGHVKERHAKDAAIVHKLSGLGYGSWNSTQGVRSHGSGKAKLVGKGAV